MDGESIFQYNVKVKTTQEEEIYEKKVISACFGSNDVRGTFTVRLRRLEGFQERCSKSGKYKG